MDVKELFETQIPVGAEHKPMTDRVAAGRRALRRRQLASVSAASVAVVTVVGIVGAVVNVGDLRSDRDNPPATSTPSPTASATYTPPPPDEELTNAIPVGHDFGECVDDYDPVSGSVDIPCEQDMLSMGRAGVIRRREGVQISQRVDDPFEDPAVEDGVALEATYKGTTQWVFLSNGKGGGTLQAPPSLYPGKSFEDWAAELTPVTGPDQRHPELKDAEGVTRIGAAWYDTAGKLVIRDDAEVVERIDNPLGYPDEDDSVAIAATVDGVEWWTLLSGPPAWHFDIQAAGDGDFQEWVDDRVKSAYTNASPVTFNKEGELVSTGGGRIVNQIINPDIDWITEPGERSALVEYADDYMPGRSFILIRTRNSAFEGALESISISYHREKDTLQTVLARLQKKKG